MIIQTTNNRLPINHRKPTRQELSAQMEREEQQSALGRLRAEKKLKDQKKGMDYSRSQGGEFLLDKCLNMTSAAIEQAMQASVKGAGWGSALVGQVYDSVSNKALVNLPKFDKEGNATDQLVRKSEKTVNLWDSDEVAFIVLLTMIDTCRMPMLGSIDNQSKAGKRYGTRPNNYKLESLISERINDHLAHKYIRECTKGTGKDGLMDWILKDSYSNQASAQQKKTVTRLARKEQAQEFIDKGLSSLADVLLWKPFTNREGHALAAKLISYTQMGCELALDFSVFETVDKYNEQFYGLTEPAEVFVDQLDQTRIGRSFLPDVMVCPPRPHTKHSSGGYIGAAQGLIRRSFTGGFKGEFIPSDKHLRLLNGQQNVPYRINKVVLDLLNRLKDQPFQDWREQGHFIPTPNSDEYLKTEKPGPKPEFMSDEEKEARKTQVKARGKEWAIYMHKKKESEGSLTEDTLALANRVSDLERFWLPTQGDFRGRVYCANHLLNAQGMSYQRSLLEFANGKQEDHRTKYHIELAIAGYAGQDKKSYEERIQWFQHHKDQIMDNLKDWDSILDPRSFWRKYPHMDDPFAFFDCAMEWRRLYHLNDPNRVTHLIVHRDASCSGGQLLASLLCSGQTARATNLHPDNTSVFDIYRRVLETMKELIRKDDYRVPLRDHRGEVVKDPNGSDLYMTQARVRYLFKQDEEVRAAIRKGIKGGFLPRLYGAGIPKTVAGMREKFKFVGYAKKSQRLTKQEAQGLAPYFEAGLNEAVPALTSYVEWARKMADLALRTPIETFTKAGKPTKRQAYENKVDENGDNIIELRCPTANGSVMVQKYLATETKPLRVDHLNTHSKFKPITSYRDAQLQVAVKEVSHKDIQKAMPPNVVHAADACVLSYAVDGFEGNYSLIHDSIGTSPCADLDHLLEQANEGIYQTTANGYLEAILEANGIDPLDNPIPNFGTFDRELIRKNPPYAWC